MQDAARDVVVTGLGAVCALGSNAQALWESIESGHDGIRPITRFPVDEFQVKTGALVPACSEPSAASNGSEGLCRQFAEDASREAIRDACLDTGCARPDRIAFIFGTGLGGGERPIHDLAQRLAKNLDLRGPCITVSNACSSSTGALGIGRDLIAMGAVDAAVAGGSDVLSPEVFAGFHALGVLNPDRCAPFSFPFGTTLGEGAGFVVLERGSAARERGARPRAALPGYGLSGDAFHETSPDPTGSGVERALRGALGDAGLSADDVGYVNAHGSGTEANDPSEWRGIQRGLGRRAHELPVSSTKGALGHAQGAAGVLETITTILAMERGLIPPTLHFAKHRPQGPADPVAASHPRPWTCEHALCLNSAFGGSNAALLVSKPCWSSSPRTRRPIFIRGLGVVGPSGAETEASEALARERNGLRGRVPSFPIERHVPTADPRGLDPMSRFLVAAAALALKDAGLTIRGATRDRVGLFVGATRPSPASGGEFRRSIDVRGLTGVSASAFSRIVLNAPAGFCSKLLSLRGPLSTVTTGAGSGLAAVVLAAELLSTREEVDWMIAGGVDEIAPDGSCADSEGAVCLLLEGERSEPGEPGVRVAGWGMAGSGHLSDAIEMARRGATMPRGGSEKVFAEEDWIRNGSTREEARASGLACAAAVLALRRGEADQVLVTSDPRGAASMALLLTR
jgi:3-oxoacyl-[acyl-carrier-protein] synthase II